MKKPPYQERVAYIIREGMKDIKMTDWSVPKRKKKMRKI